MYLWVGISIVIIGVVSLFVFFLPLIIFNMYTRFQRFHNKTTPADFGLNFENLDFFSKSTKHQAWFIYPPGKENSAELPTVIMPHGYAANREQIIDRSCHIAKAGFAVFTFDWRRCGESEGDRISLGLLEKDDLLAAIKFASSLPQTDPDKLALYGFSMGAATSVIAAAEAETIKCLIADSPFSSIEEITGFTLKQMLIPKCLVWKKLSRLFREEFARDISEFDAAAVVNKIAPRPVLVIGNREDRMVPFWQIEKVFEAASQPKSFYVKNQGGHFSNAEAEILDAQVIPFLKAGFKID